MSYPEVFGSRFMEWVRSIQELTQGQVIAVARKQLRGFAERVIGKAAINVISARASANPVLLGEVKVLDT